MKKLINQILKFGIVGVIAFFVDFVVFMAVTMALGKTNVSDLFARIVGGFFGFTISVIVNYVLSMKFVFTRKKDISRKKEFTIFLILSLIGLLLNEILLALGTAFFNHAFTEFAKNHVNIVSVIDKVFATGIVMVYNFVSRKIFLEDHSANKEDTE